MAQEGQTATNPNTGERVVYQGGSWRPMGGGQTPVGLPVFRTPMSPQQESSEQRAQQDQAMQQENFQRTAANDAARLELARKQEERQAATDARKAAEDARKLQALGGAVDASVEQGKAASFYNRAMGSNTRFGELEAQGLEAPGLGRTIAQSILPESIVNTFTDDARQLGEAEQRNFIAATLRYESGAAIPDREFATQSRIFFPQPGDAPDTIERKRLLREEAIQGLRGAAGPAVANLRASNTGVASGSEQRGFSLSPEDESKLLAFAPDASSPAEIVAFARGLGVTIPQEEAQRAFDYYRQGGREAAQISYGAANRALAGERDTGGGAVDAAVRGIADTAALGFADELAAAGDTIFGSGTMRDNLARQRAIDATDEEVNPYARLGGQIAGGFALPVGAATGARGLARVGAIYGAGYGVGSAEGGAYDRLVGGLQGGAVGGAVGGGLGGLSRLIPRSGGGGPTGGRGADVMRAGQELGVEPIPAYVGGPFTGRLTAGAAQTIGGAGPIMRANQRIQQGAADVLSGIATTEGAPVRQEVLGETAQRAAQGYIDQSGRVGGELYREARNLAGDTRIQGRQALDTLDQNIAELAQTPNTSAPVVSGLQRFRDDLAVTLENGATERRRLPVDAIRALRTNVRAEAQTDALRATDYQRRANQVLDALSEDIASQLSPEARQAFQRADQAWAERLNVIDDVMSQVIGPQGDRSAEAVAQRLASMSRGDSARLRTFINNVNQEEAGVIRGSLIQELGRATKGQQTAAGDGFSLEKFLSNWDDLPDRTRQILFRGDSRQAIESLAVLAQGARNASGFANTSNTGGATNAAAAIQSISAITGWGTAGASLVLENITARMLASPAVARIIARPPSDRGRLIRRLTEAGVREPALAPDISRFVQALETGPGRAAAQEDSQ